MDSITQAVLGASIQGALLGRWQGRKALLYGAMLGTLPDLDVIIDYGDAVADMTYHRGFSHSLLVLTGLALLLTWLTRRFRHNPGYSAQRLFLTLWLVLITHPLLDSFIHSHLFRRRIKPLVPRSLRVWGRQALLPTPDEIEVSLSESDLAFIDTRIADKHAFQ